MENQEMENRREEDKLGRHWNSLGKPQTGLNRAISDYCCSSLFERPVRHGRSPTVPTPQMPAMAVASQGPNQEMEPNPWPAATYGAHYQETATGSTVVI